MKKLLLSLTLVCAVALLTAQTPVNNGGFENWSGDATAQQPVGWTTVLAGDILTEMFGVQIPIPVSTNFGTRITDAHSGSSALQLQPAEVGIPSTEYSALFPGIAQLGVAQGFQIPLQTILDIASLLSGDSTGVDPGQIDPSALASLAQVLAPGDTCSKTPQAINLWVKYAPANDDEAVILAFTKLNGQYVGYAEYDIDDAVNEYTLITAPFEQAGAPCDSLYIIIMSSSADSADPNTILCVDDVSITPFTVGVADLNEPKFYTYPNPATEYVRVAPSVSDPFTCQVFDLQGRLLRVVESNGEQCTVDVSDLANGIYTLRVDQKGRVTNQKIMVR